MKRIVTTIIAVLAMSVMLAACDSVATGSGMTGGTVFAPAIGNNCDIIDCIDETHAHNSCGGADCLIVTDHTHGGYDCEISGCNQTEAHIHCGTSGCSEIGAHIHCGTSGCNQAEAHSHGSCGIDGCKQKGSHGHKGHGAHH